MINEVGQSGMNKNTFIAIGAGLASALLSVAVAYGSGIGLVLAYFALLPMLLIGLSGGPKSAGIAATAGVFGAIFLTNIFQGALFGITVALPAWLIVRYTLMTRTARDGTTHRFPMGEVLARLAALGAIVLVISSVTYFDAPGGFPKTIENFLDNILSARVQFNVPAERHLLVQRLIPFFPAIIVSSWIVMTLINSMIAQTILLKAGRNLRPAIQYSQIRAPEWLYWGIVAGGGIALLGSGAFEYVGRNLVMILAIPFFFIGLAIAHTLVRFLRSPGVALGAFYFLMIISSWAIVAVATIGYFEEWVGLRQKFGSSPQKADEDE
jgi:hypothetical protein